VKREVLPSLVTLLTLVFIDLCVFVRVEEGILQLIINKLFGILRTDGRTEERTDGQTDGQQTDRQIYGQQTDRQTNSRTDRQTDGQLEGFLKVFVCSNSTLKADKQAKN
jgi:Cu2+-containing amine oxidase